MRVVERRFNALGHALARGGGGILLYYTKWHPTRIPHFQNRLRHHCSFVSVIFSFETIT